MDQRMATCAVARRRRDEKGPYVKIKRGIDAAPALFDPIRVERLLDV
jgi:hypothetical protein